MKKIRALIITISCIGFLVLSVPAAAISPGGPCGGMGINWIETLKNLIEQMKNMIAQAGRTDVHQVGQNELVGLRDAMGKEGLTADVAVVTSFGRNQRIVGLTDGTLLVTDARGRITYEMSGGYALKYGPKP